MELEEAIKILTDDNKTYQLNKLLNDTLNIESPKYYQAIETVLQELEKLQQKEKSRIIGNIYEIKIEDLQPVLKPYYVPKKKIEDKKQWLEEKLCR